MGQRIDDRVMASSRDTKLPEEHDDLIPSEEIAEGKTTTIDSGPSAPEPEAKSTLGPEPEAEAEHCACRFCPIRESYIQRTGCSSSNFDAKISEEIQEKLHLLFMLDPSKKNLCVHESGVVCGSSLFCFKYGCDGYASYDIDTIDTGRPCLCEDHRESASEVFYEIAERLNRIGRYGIFASFV